MTRIIAGFARSRTLKVPRHGTRPTSDRVREAMFSALDARDVIEGAYVCDLFAGSGALGLEALSRGAMHVTLVDHNAEAAEISTANARIVCEAGNLDSQRVAVRKSTVTSFLQSASQTWDLVFIDPPYEMAHEDIAEVLDKLFPHLSEDAVVLLERSSRDEEVFFHPHYKQHKSSKYGETTLHWLSPVKHTSGS